MGNCDKYEERFLRDSYNLYSESMEPFAEWFARKTCKTPVREDVRDDSLYMYSLTERDICRVNGGAWAHSVHTSGQKGGPRQI